MKRLFTILITVLFSVALFAQTPQKMSYQAVIRNSSNALVISTPIGMQISILQGTSTGTPVYVETQAPTTNANGLVTIEIGGGTIVSGSFAGIDWTAGPYYIKTEIAVTAPLTTYTITGTTQLLSVPFALLAKTAASYTETDPVYSAWNKTTGISIPSSQVSDFQTAVTNNAAVLLNTAKISYPPADAAKLAAITGTNTGDNAVNSLYSGLVTNATHTGDASGSGVLTLATVNSNVGTFNNITINAKGLATAGTNVSYLTAETDPAVKAITGIVKSNGTTISAATSGTDYSAGTSALTTGILKSTTATGALSIAVAGDFPQLDQNTTGSAGSFTGTLGGEVTGTQAATVVGNAAVIGKVLTGFTSGLGTVAATDNILTAIQKLDGNIKALPGGSTHYLGEPLDGGVVFNIYRDNLGEHGLIVALTESTTDLSWQNTGTSTGATSSWDGSSNTTSMTDSPAKTYVTSLGAGWYMPSLDELELLFQNRFYVNKALTAGSNTLVGYRDYWSSTEYNDTDAFSFYFYDNSTGRGPKTNLGAVRAIRAF